MTDRLPELRRLPPTMSAIRTNLPNVHTFEIPPNDLDLRKADTATLLRYGIPLRPRGEGSARAAAIRDKLLARNLRRIAPVLRPRPEIKTYARQGFGAPETSGVWSGGVLKSASDPLHFVFGQWVVPAVMPPSGAGDGDWWTVAWVGMDGDTSSDVLQAGTAQHVHRSGSKITTEYFAWYEWFTDSWIEFDKFEIDPGDTVAVSVSFDGVDDKGVQWGSATVSNLSRGTTTSARFNPPAGITFKGDSAEWIMERPQFDKVPAKLPEYGEIVFTNCIACSAAKTFDATAAQPIDMKDGATTISVGVLEQDWKCTFVPT